MTNAPRKAGLCHRSHRPRSLFILAPTSLVSSHPPPSPSAAHSSGERIMLARDTATLTGGRVRRSIHYVSYHVAVELQDSRDRSSSPTYSCLPHADPAPTSHGTFVQRACRPPTTFTTAPPFHSVRLHHTRAYAPTYNYIDTLRYF